MNNSRYPLAFWSDTGLSALLDEFDPVHDSTPALAEWSPLAPLDSAFANGWQSDLSAQSEMATRFRLECCRSLLEMSETDPDLRWHPRRVSAVLDRIYEAATAKVESAASARGLDPAVLHFKKPPSATVLRWLAILEASGEDPMSLCPAVGSRAQGNRKRLSRRAAAGFGKSTVRASFIG